MRGTDLTQTVRKNELLSPVGLASHVLLYIAFPKGLFSFMYSLQTCSDGQGHFKKTKSNKNNKKLPRQFEMKIQKESKIPYFDESQDVVNKQTKLFKNYVINNWEIGRINHVDHSLSLTYLSVLPYCFACESKYDFIFYLLPQRNFCDTPNQFWFSPMEF